MVAQQILVLFVKVRILVRQLRCIDYQWIMVLLHVFVHEFGSKRVGKEPTLF